MCGRYTLRASGDELADLFRLDSAPCLPLEPRYNIAPTQPVPAVRLGEGGGRELVALRWGMIPMAQPSCPPLWVWGANVL